MTASPRRPPVTRFAPSPTGPLHLGHAYAAWVAWAGAQQAGGRFLLRIEDIDQGRCRREFEAAIFEDLRWLGLHWEGTVRRQSEHMEAYGQALAALERQGLVYPCFCTRKDIAREIQRAGAAPHLIPSGGPHDPPYEPGHGPDGPLYPGTCRGLSDNDRRARMEGGEPFALRLHMAKATARYPNLAWNDIDRGPQTARPDLFGDVVLARKDTPTSYHLSVTVDDALQDVSLVTRGEDLLESTHVHRLLQAALGLPVPGYRHHRLILNADGKRFAKRDKGVTLAHLRESGATPPDIWDRLDIPAAKRP